MGEQNKPRLWRTIIQAVVVVVAAPFIPLLVSGDWAWWPAWACAGTCILSFVISRVIAWRIHPDLIAKRACAPDRPPSGI